MIEMNRDAAQPRGQFAPVVAPLIQQQTAAAVPVPPVVQPQASISNDDSSGGVISGHSSRAANATILPVNGPMPVVDLISIFAIIPCSGNVPPPAKATVAAHLKHFAVPTARIHAQ